MSETRTKVRYVVVKTGLGKHAEKVKPKVFRNHNAFQAHIL